MTLNEDGVRLKDSHSNIEIPSAVVPGLKALGPKALSRFKAPKANNEVS